MNILIVVANPRQQSFSFAMANKYKELMLSKNNKVEILDLYRDENQQPYFIYLITGANRRLKNMFKKQIVEFCGMELDEFNIFGSIDTSTKDTTKILNAIK